MKRARDVREQLVGLLERVELELTSDSDEDKLAKVRAAPLPPHAPHPTCWLGGLVWRCGVWLAKFPHRTFGAVLHRAHHVNLSIERSFA